MQNFEEVKQIIPKNNYNPNGNKNIGGEQNEEEIRLHNLEIEMPENNVLREMIENQPSNAK